MAATEGRSTDLSLEHVRITRRGPYVHVRFDVGLGSDNPHVALNAQDACRLADHLWEVGLVAGAAVAGS